VLADDLSLSLFVTEMREKFAAFAAAAAIAVLTRARADEVAAAPAEAGSVDAALEECAWVEARRSLCPDAFIG
jgi:hypothetical protein